MKQVLRSAMRRSGIIVTLALCLLLMLFLAACGGAKTGVGPDAAEEGAHAGLSAQDARQSALDAIRARGVLRVGTAGDYQPMSYLDPATKRYVGFDAALAEDLAAALSKDGLDLACKSIAGNEH